MTMALGLDVGTQSVKALLLDGDRNQVIATASAPLATVPGLPPGHSEQRPSDWLAAICTAVRALHSQHEGALATVRGIGVSGQQHGMVPLDAADAVIRPAKLWNDTASAEECRSIVAAVGGERALFRATGNALPPGFTAGKVRWLRDREPQSFARLRTVLLPHDYVNLWLTGEKCQEAGDASGTGYFDVRRRRFAAAVVDAVAPELAGMLPPLREPGEPAGRLRAEAAAALGLQSGAVVSHGSGDNMMAAIGAGAVRPKIAVLSLGTSGTVFACADAPVCDPRGEIAGFCDAGGGWLPLGCTMNATVTTELTRAVLGLDLDGLERAAAAAPAGAGGALCLPFFTGERSPNLPDGSGAFVGLTPASMQPGHLARAAFEGATFALVALLDRLHELGVPPGELRLTGGGSRSLLWCRIVAAAAAAPVRLGVHADAAALGAAIHALWTLQRLQDRQRTLREVVADLGDPCAGGELLDPDPEWTAVYGASKPAYAAATAALTPVFPALRGR